MAIAALLIFLVILLAILLGYPVAICLGGVSLVAGYFLLGPAFMQFLPSRIVGTFSNYVLLAVPMFVLMGTLLQRSGLAAVLMRAAAQALGRTPGGLGLAVLFVGSLLAASTGIVGASVVTLALIALPVMEEAGYRRSFASGVVAGAGTLGQIVPPSIVLVLLGSIMQVSVGDLFTAAIRPSIVLIAAYAILIIATAILRPNWVPAHKSASVKTPSDDPHPHSASAKTLGSPSFSAATDDPHSASAKTPGSPCFSAATDDPHSACAKTLGSPCFSAATDDPHSASAKTPNDDASTASASMLGRGTNDFKSPNQPQVLPKGELKSPKSLTQVLPKGEDTPLSKTPSLLLGVLGPLLLIGVVLGSILVGAASPTEASGLGAVIALALLYASGNGSLRQVESAAVEALRLTSMVYLILLGATTFALVFRGLGGDDVLVESVTSAGLDAQTFVLVLMLTVFIAGFFIDFIEITFIVVPVALPLIQAYGIDPLWLCVCLGINLQTSFLTPPFGFSLFYLRGSAPAAYTTADIYRGVIPYVSIQLLLLLSVLFWPEFYGLSATLP